MLQEKCPQAVSPSLYPTVGLQGSTSPLKFTGTFNLAQIYYTDLRREHHGTLGLDQLLPHFSS
jgi:hypothetical protein